jgi:YD repeat-containing protein
MRIRFICLALADILLCPTSSSQGRQTISPDDQRVPHLSVTGVNAFQSTPYRFRTNKLTHGGLNNNPATIRRTLSPQSQIYVIDTAIVRKLGRVGHYPGDTTMQVNSFNASGKRTASVTQILEGNLWKNLRRQTNTYDSNNNMLSDLYEVWSNGQWDFNNLETYTYDANGKMHSWLTNDYRKTYTYDADGNLLTVLEEYGHTGQWVNLSRETHTYDADGNLLTHLNEHWLDNGQWGGNWRNTYTYDENGNMLSWLDEQWSDGQWANRQRHTYTYDANNNMLLDLLESWSEQGQWVISELIRYTLDAKGDVLSKLREYWWGNHWVDDWRSTYTYDATGNILSQLDETCYDNQWGNNQRWTYSYDAKGNLTSLWHCSWPESSWTPADFPVFTWGTSWPGSWGVTDSAGNYYYLGCGYNFTLAYKTVLTGLPSECGNLPATHSLSQNYPNPFNPSTTIKFELPKLSEVRLSVFDILGRQISLLVNERRNAGVHEVKFDASRLSSGVYFYRLQAGTYVETRKLLLQR